MTAAADRSKRPAAAGLLAAFLAAALAPRAGLAGEALTGALSVELDAALVRYDKAVRRAVPIVLDLECDAGRWDRQVWGWGVFYNRAEHLGEIESAEAAGGAIRLSVVLSIEKDACGTGGGLARWQVRLRRQGSRLDGAFTGTFNDVPVSGKARGTIGPLRKPPAGFVPPRPGEHPRLLFRKKDLPALKEKMARLARLGRCELPAEMMYPFTGRREHAEAGRAAAERLMKTPGSRILEYADVPSRLAILYDLNYDGWDAAFRREVTDWLQRTLRVFLFGQADSGSKPTPWSTWQGRARSCAGLACLAILGEKGALLVREPVEPPALVKVAPPEGFAPPTGAPVVKYADKALLRDWLFVGPFPPAREGRPLDGLGGPEKLHPAAGTPVKVANKTWFFRKAPKNCFLKAYFTGGREVLQVPGQAITQTSYLYAVLDNDRPRGVKVSFEHAGVTCWFAGQAVPDGGVVHLPAGKLGMLVEIAGKPGAPDWVIPRLADEDVGGLLLKRGLYDRRLARYNADHQAWARDDERLPYARRWLTIATRSVRRYLDTCYGERGWNTEGEAYTHHTLSLVLPFLHACRSVTGVDLVEGTGAEWLLPIYAAKQVFGPRPGQAFAPALGVGSGRADGAGLLARGFGTVPARYRPAVLWHWNRLAAEKKDRSIYSLVNYPLDLAESNPGGVYGNAIADHRKGGYIFRTGWSDANDIMAWAFLKCQPLPACWSRPDAGTFRIAGLGSLWAVQGPASKAGERACENVVLAGAGDAGRLGGHETFYAARPDGSGAVSATLDDVYLRLKAGAEEYVDYGSRPIEANLIDQGIRHTRAFAADYSGASGAPGLFVVVDRMNDKGGERIWQMFPGGPVTCEGGTFTIAAGGRKTGRAAKGTPTLKGTVVYPPGARPTFERFAVAGRGEGPPRQAAAIRVRSRDGFLVVMTLQKGPAPTVQPRGRGLDAEIVVGNQVVRFDGAKILLAK